MKNLILSLQFLTRLYLPWNIDGGEDMFAKSAICFPVAGLIIGIMEAGVLFITAKILSPLTAATFTALFDVFITGGLHMDGLADTVDGLGSHRNKERMLETMKDSRIGTFGVLGILGVLLSRICLLQDLMMTEKGLLIYGVVAAIPVIGRTLLVLLIKSSRYARQDGMGGLFFKYKSVMRVPATLIIGVILSLTAVWAAPVMWLSGVIAALIVRRVCYKKIDGMTGDTLGAGLAFAEITALFAAVLWFRWL